LPDRMSSALHIVGVAAGMDGSGYHRMFQPFKALKDNSVHFYEGPPATPPPPPTRKDITDMSIDVLVMQRPVGAQGRRIWDELDGACARVYESDDDILNPEPSILARLCDDRIRESVKYMLWRSDLVTVSTPYLAEEWGKHTSAPIVVLQNVIHEDLLRMERIRRDRVTVGWAGGASHLIDLLSVAFPLNDVLEESPQADMHCIGVDYTPMQWVLRPSLLPQCRWTNWSDDVWDFYRAWDFDVALAPLYDVPFNRSKSHLKALDAFARGTPVIASDMEPYRDIVADGKNGYLVRTAEQWRARLRELVNDAAAREELGRNAKATAAEHTIQKHWQDWEAAYELAAGQARPAAEEIAR
jgi:glycosyltransferase involved in cell wall biosynthesis